MGLLLCLQVFCLAGGARTLAGEVGLVQQGRDIGAARRLTKTDAPWIKALSPQIRRSRALGHQYLMNQWALLVS